MFRFTIRDVLWLMLVVALAIGWWIDRCSQIAARERAEEFSRIALWMGNYGDVEPGTEEWRALDEVNRQECQTRIEARERMRKAGKLD